MIQLKDAIRIAKEHAPDLLGETPVSVAEFEREDYNGHPAWVITLAFAAPRSHLPPAMSLFERHGTEYRRLFIDEDSGQVLAMKIREFAHQ